MSRRVAIIVAMEMEIVPLLRRWRQQGKKVDRCDIAGMMPGARAYRCENTIVACGGIGKRAAAAATKAVIDSHEPETIISAGLAGALRGGMTVGATLRPLTVVDAASGMRHETARDNRASGVLVTATSVLSSEQKKALAQKWGADAVDMEASVVAEVAQAAAVPFGAVKAISDEVDFAMPPLHQFIDSNGRLNLLKLITYCAFRPSIWPALAALRKNSNVAAEQLAEELDRGVAG